MATDDGQTEPNPPEEFWRQLVSYASERPPIPLFGEYAGLMRLNLIHLQTDLARIKGEVHRTSKTSEEQMKKLRQKLHEYTNAIRDYEYMKKLETPPPIIGDPQMSIMYAFPDLSRLEGAPLGTRYVSFPAMLRQEDPIRETLRKYMPSDLSWTEDEKKIPGRMNDFLHGRPPEKYSPLVDSLARFIMAIGCGAALIVPMVIMSLDPSRNKSLITVSVCVLLFALFLSSGIGAKNTEVLAATATYAAVLVVFVGTSGSAQ
ncbi:hypothetical protein BHE90_005982 [Fusarium euwallaceae]|uniref:DUF6594 domain-containing protein n=1 Tax=Fusarium euwallaceae TaxID=1147111 RepID=A0A430LUV9_9HYPO|nr:hypothetical protein BHE90_005982 [Fusarium euwallaceae]